MMKTANLLFELLPHQKAERTSSNITSLHLFFIQAKGPVVQFYYCDVMMYDSLKNKTYAFLDSFLDKYRSEHPDLKGDIYVETLYLSDSDKLMFDTSYINFELPDKYSNKVIGVYGTQAAMNCMLSAFTSKYSWTEPEDYNVLLKSGMLYTEVREIFRGLPEVNTGEYTLSPELSLVEFSVSELLSFCIVDVETQGNKLKLYLGTSKQNADSAGSDWDDPLDNAGVVSSLYYQVCLDIYMPYFVTVHKLTDTCNCFINRFDIKRGLHPLFIFDFGYNTYLQDTVYFLVLGKRDTLRVYQGMKLFDFLMEYCQMEQRFSKKL